MSSPKMMSVLRFVQGSAIFCTESGSRRNAAQNYEMIMIEMGKPSRNGV